MTNKEKINARIKEIAILPAVRISSGDDAHFAAEAVTHGGIPIVEITMTVPGAVELIAHLCNSQKGLIAGAGTVLDVETARKCLEVGACFITAPSFSPEVVEFVAKQGITVIPGALTPTEVIRAWNQGADFVKVFPCAPVGGERYIRALHSSLPQVPLIAAGGVNQQTAAGYILSGATAIGVGQELIPQEAIEKRQSARIKELARRFAKIVKEAKEQIEDWKRSLVVKTYTGTEECEEQSGRHHSIK
ncbi:MAG TPA: bifunctional 4-hydroxy-2-oxoglutarate aldolase/2-dehydro-3-deoxy-phosphogluconate aldolase [Bryocella sp.]|nr:bifunctional 4-hydroxy-2-oxoglutarate aldolase/2-dehydro-3-deoxy-phosphogluconate aldolase [Bryocella sp.]